MVGSREREKMKGRERNRPRHRVVDEKRSQMEIAVLRDFVRRIILFVLFPLDRLAKIPVDVVFISIRSFIIFVQSHELPIQEKIIETDMREREGVGGNTVNEDRI